MGGVDGLHKLPRGSVIGGEVVRVGGRDWKVDFTLDDRVAFGQVEEGLQRYLSGTHGWFAGGAVTVNVGRRVLNTEELGRLRRILEEEYQLKVIRFSCKTEFLEQEISERAGIPVALVPGQQAPSPMNQAPRSQNPPLLLKGTCRSGAFIHHNGDVVVLGDVNPGAHVTATGDVIVLGTLRGVAHAGANADDPTKSVIIALALRPLQLRIGWHVCVEAEDKDKHTIQWSPEIAYVSGHTIVVEPFSSNFQSMLGRSLS